MATVAQKLTVAEFERQYGHEKPYYEFWRGEAVQKSMPTWIHGLLQKIVMNLLGQAGYKAGSEVKLKIDPDFHPLPDVIATRGRIETPYPTKAVEVVVEILSDDDPMWRILTKCRAYQGWGFEQIYVIDPQTRVVFRWTDQRLEEVNAFASIPVDGIWLALDEELR
ncbi:MAG TPA: Uma2 family endonuclease [Bryobacteraceae bacterium]|jgi:Uma2 family endonuclease